MASEDVALMAHLMRRAGFGASRDELEARAAKGYEATVEELVNPEAEPVDRYEFFRYQPGFWKPVTSPGMGMAAWFYTMLNTQRPLEEKMVLFWHQVFATGQSKIDHWHELITQADMFREKGMDNYRDLLVELAKNPAMIYWLDNCDNHAYAVNENWGRELLELFSMGVGNYTEEDVREASRAFTGWTIAVAPPRGYYNRWDWEFEYREEDHDDGEKTFLGHTGNFDGEDIIDIIVQQPACHRFIARHLYNYFVADDAQVPAWMDTPPQDPETIKMLEDEYFRSGYNIRSMLRVLFNSDVFKNARFARIKSPIEAVVGTMRLIGDWTAPKPGFEPIFDEMKHMGQEILNPPSVEGWHTGKEWIDGGTLVQRINFIADRVGDLNYPGIQDITKKLASEGPTISPEALVDGCLRLLGHYELVDETRHMLVDHARKSGELRTTTAEFPEQVGQMLQMIVATKEYLYA